MCDSEELPSYHRKESLRKETLLRNGTNAFLTLMESVT